MLTKDVHLLWGGSTLPPPSPGDKKCGLRNGVNGKESIRHTPSEQQILSFILTMYPTFVHPVILMRLLLHRFLSFVICTSSHLDYIVLRSRVNGNHNKQGGQKIPDNDTTGRVRISKDRKFGLTV